MANGFPACLPCPGSLDNAAWAQISTQDILHFPDQIVKNASKTETCFGVFSSIHTQPSFNLLFLSIQVVKTFAYHHSTPPRLRTSRASPTPAGIDWGKSMWKRITNFPALEGSWRMEVPPGGFDYPLRKIACKQVKNRPYLFGWWLGNGFFWWLHINICSFQFLIDVGLMILSQHLGMVFSTGPLCVACLRLQFARRRRVSAPDGEKDRWFNG